MSEKNTTEILFFRPFLKKIILLFLFAFSGLHLFFYLLFHPHKRHAEHPMAEEEKFFSSTFGRIHYVTKGTGRPLLLIHDATVGESHKEWQRAIHALSKHYTVYALDLLGFGDSDKPKMTYSAYLYVQVIRHFVLQVIQQKTYVAASGLSSSFVLLAQKFDANLFDKMILISPPNLTHKQNLPVNKDRWVKMLFESSTIGTALYAFFASKSSLRNHLQTKIYHPLSKPKSSKSFRLLVNRLHRDAYKGVNAKYPYASLRAHYLNTALLPTLKEITVPIHMIWGEKNTRNTLRNLFDYEQSNRNISYTIFENTKSLPHLENPKAFDTVCQLFFLPNA